jgi:hypothetical protein
MLVPTSLAINDIDSAEKGFEDAEEPGAAGNCQALRFNEIQFLMIGMNKARTTARKLVNRSTEDLNDNDSETDVPNQDFTAPIEVGLIACKRLKINGSAYGTRTRDLCLERAAC